MTAIVDAAALGRLFADPSPPTLGLEEEVLLLDPVSLDLAPVVGEAVAALATARADLAFATAGTVELAAAGLHPFTAAEGRLNEGPRYDATAEEHAVVARRQLVSALQVHVAVRGEGRALPVYNALRSHLPELAALAANAPFHDGRDTGLASGRPTVGGQLPRQGVPPPLRSWAAYADALAWAGDPGRWWWELRPHPRHGTLELRVPDAERHDAGERLPVADTWRIEENRWSACRYGVQGEMRDLATGRRESTRERLARLLDALGGTARALRCERELADAGRLVQRNGAMVMSEAAAGDPVQATRWLRDRFLAGLPAPAIAVPYAEGE
jgi:carboxylate-amine ligase